MDKDPKLDELNSRIRPYPDPQAKPQQPGMTDPGLAQNENDQGHSGPTGHGQAVARPEPVGCQDHKTQGWQEKQCAIHSNL